MPASRHRPWIRRVLLAVNVAFPPAMLAAIFARHPLWPAAMLATAVVHALLLTAILHPRCEWLGPVISRFRTDRNEVWLTIDDGPDAGTAQLAQALRSRGVRATFFVIGARLAAHPEAARALSDAGHTLENHSATHPRKLFWCLPRKRVIAEVEGCATALAAAAPGTHSLFRGPVGHKPPTLHPRLGKRSMQFVSWTVGGRDGWSADVSETVDRVVAAARPGAIILLHECRAHSHTTILATVDALLARGFTFTIPEAAQLGAIQSRA